MLRKALGTITELCGEESVEVAEVLTYLGGTYYRWSQLQKSRYATKSATEFEVHIAYFIITIGYIHFCPLL